MLSITNSALLVLVAYALSGILASPITPEYVTKASNVAAELSGSSGSDGISGITFKDSTFILYRYECPVGGIESRIIRIGADFDGEWTTFHNLVNAENVSVKNVEDIGSMSYKVTGEFQHGMCLARSQFRYCGYSLSAGLEGTARIDETGADFHVPTKSGTYHGAPIVTEACTRSNGHAKDCATAGKSVQCKVSKILSTP